MDYNEFAGKASIAAGTVIDESRVDFYAGTMFVTCTTYEAAKIETALIKALNCGVIVSKVGPQFAFDFTV